MNAFIDSAVRGGGRVYIHCAMGKSRSATAVCAYLMWKFGLSPAKALEQINSQYWVSSFLNGSEAWANFRRSGFPVLPINMYPGKDPSVKDFIKRLVYPVRERSVNEANYKEAVARMGPDELGTPIFWDK